jgi:purine-binding chemotaxis protein CheW
MSAFMNLADGLLKDESQLVVVCSISGNILGVPTGPIQEVLAMPEIRPVHHAPAYVIGVFNLRGKVLALIDPAVKLGLPPQNLAADSRILVIQSGSELVGVLVDELTGIFPYIPDQLTSKPESLQASMRQSIEGFFFLSGQMVGLLKINELLGRDEMPSEGGST